MTLIERIADWFHKIPANIRHYADEALKITTSIRNGLESGEGTVLVSLIPGTWAEDVKAEAIKFLTGMMAVITKLEEIGDVPPLSKQESKEALLQRMQSGLVRIQDGAVLSQHEYDTDTQVCYSKAKQ